ncbi:hypothetical protein DFP72DRAFT_265070 [Ephemerocybe angulata]|uniref:Uncharacterized protein n=1 Tax=Ephemerocybe angulata TaxID=980116 RepID=A0A8H6I1L6_9AGAR|nr:hypothetical protein DFP72DRAFT_265070 [Tulosesus angulatus]
MLLFIHGGCRRDLPMPSRDGRRDGLVGRSKSTAGATWTLALDSVHSSSVVPRERWLGVRLCEKGVSVLVGCFATWPESGGSGFALMGLDSKCVFERDSGALGAEIGVFALEAGTYSGSGNRSRGRVRVCLSFDLLAHAPVPPSVCLSVFRSVPSPYWAVWFSS